MSPATVPAPRPPRVVADSNVFISALLGGARASAVLAAARRAMITLYASEYLFAEVARILDAKFYWPPARVQDALTGMRGYVIIVPPASRSITVVRDPKDNPILECRESERVPARRRSLTASRRKAGLGTGSGQCPDAALRRAEPTARFCNPLRE